MKYRHNAKPKKSRRWAWVLVLLVVTVLYSIVVWGWIQEGNRNFDAQRQAHAEGLKNTI